MKTDDTYTPRKISAFVKTRFKNIMYKPKKDCL